MKSGELIISVSGIIVPFGDLIVSTEGRYVSPIGSGTVFCAGGMVIPLEDRPGAYLWAANGNRREAGPGSVWVNGAVIGSLEGLV